ncbi:AraC family transcriptional regulator [Sphingobacterium bovistauri]|uniref:Helix-turn-helix domain-containing protein n=1 Tax=Sphingobacterium bovistauri TaxID=2781959 RepID=A0ABS7Z3Q1_9SPHI|nr:AraC family transcriptional regulator [Sphingobacterium bovistauri]MCA5004808.1 helix-turn-helix domain-containing protein [Sphingobacterium bovistauri]
MHELFNIFKIDNSLVESIANNPNIPHQHNYEELIIVLRGKLSHFIDYKTQNLEAPCISFVTKGKIHRLQPEILDNEFEGWAIRFKSEFIPEITFQLYNYYHDRANFRLLDHKSASRLHILCQLIFEEHTSDTQELSIIKELLSALFTIIESERKKAHTDDNNITNNQNTTFKTFLQILEENFRRPEGVNFYAEKLFMSSKSLNNITQHILHLPVSEIIETRKLIEAKKLLFTTDKSIAEIGFELGYQDKAYFTSVFKKKSGQTPSEFREEMKSLLS